MKNIAHPHFQPQPRARLLVRATISALWLACCAGGAQASATCPPAPRAIASAAEAQALAQDAASACKLSPIPLQCVESQSISDTGTNDGHGPWQVLFHEHHSVECGGDPLTGPRLFTIKVTNKGLMTTDAYGKDITSGRFRRLKRPKAAR
jgi:hypothetical protein